MDADGQYKGLDQNIHRAAGFTNYTTFSLWDTYRALHPFFNIVQPARNRDMVRSMMAHYDQSVHKMLPVWSHYANENWCMIGYHSVSVIADAVIKGNISGRGSPKSARCIGPDRANKILRRPRILHEDGLRAGGQEFLFRFENPRICLRRLVHRADGKKAGPYCDL